jgi:hypothetical protein
METERLGGWLCFASGRVAGSHLQLHRLPLCGGRGRRPFLGHHQVVGVLDVLAKLLSLAGLLGLRPSDP